jgi:hypothetical protein
MLAQPSVLIPDQYTGNKTDNWFSIIADTENGAARLFRTAVERLLDVNNWSRLCGISSASFRLTDAKGMEVDRPIEPGDHFRIDIPGPGTTTGNGYDWVEIEKIEKHFNPCAEWESISVIVRPSPNPQNNDADTAHFFSADATSTFAIQREKKRVTAEVHGRNEKPNTETGNTLDNLRNTIVGTTALTGFSDIQWKQLVKGILS